MSAERLCKHERVRQVRECLARADLVGYTIDDAAASLHVNPLSLRQALRRAGTTWSRELYRERRQRLLEALDDAPASEHEFLAVLCGYAWTVSFDRFFKRAMGCTICAWRLKNCPTEDITS